MISSIRPRTQWRRLVGTILAALVFATLVPTAAQAAPVTESEPNNSISTANRLAPGDTVSGSALSSAWGGDDDYYAIDLPKAGRLTLNLKFPANLGTTRAYDVRVYNASGKQLYDWTINADEYDGKWLAGQGSFTDSGRIYVRIYGSNSWVTWGKTYTLNATLTPGTVETEPNNDTSTADALATGSTVSGSALGSAWGGDDDYYAIDLPKAGRLTLNLKFPANLGTTRAYDVRVYNASGKQLYDWTIAGSQHTSALTANLGVGRSYVRIYGSNSWVTWGETYTLTVSRPPLSLTKTPTPKITGTAKVGSTLKANPGTWAPAPVSLTYQWLRNGKAIAKATKSSYKLVKADKGKKIAVKVTGSKAGYQKVAKTSAAKTIK